MNRMLLVLTLAALLGFTQPAQAQGSDAKKQIQSTVEALLNDLGSLKVDALPDYFAPGAVLIVARQGKDGFDNTVTSADEWIQNMRERSDQNQFEERIFDIEITIDSGELAYLRAGFEIVRDGKVRSSGIDVFTLIRSGDDWKVAAIAYTNIPAPE